MTTHQLRYIQTRKSSGNRLILGNYGHTVINKLSISLSEWSPEIVPISFFIPLKDFLSKNINAHLSTLALFKVLDLVPGKSDKVQ